MKTILSPNLKDGEPVFSVRLIQARRFARGGLASAAERVRSAGRHGDDMLVHMNKHEFNQLRNAWGEPTRHPHTGMPQYDLTDWLGNFYNNAGGWQGLLQSAAPYIGGMLSGKSNVDQANQHLAPLPDVNMQRPLGHYTNPRAYIPGSSAGVPTIGEGERTYFTHNNLGDIRGAIPAPLSGPQQTSPSTLGAIGGGLGMGLLQKLLGQYMRPGQSSASAANSPISQAGNAGALGALASQASGGAGDLTPLSGGTITTEEVGDPASASSTGFLGTGNPALDSTAASTGGAGVSTGGGGLNMLIGSSGGADAAGAGGAAAGSDSLLPGSIAGADMSDTAAYTPAMMDATSGAGSGGLGLLGGLAAGGAGFAGFNALANFLMQNGSMTPADYQRTWNDQASNLKTQIAQTSDPAQKAALEQKLQGIQASLVMLQRGLSGYGGRANLGIMAQHPMHRGGRVQHFAMGGLPMANFAQQQPYAANQMGGGFLGGAPPPNAAGPMSNLRPQVMPGGFGSPAPAPGAPNFAPPSAPPLPRTGLGMNPMWSPMGGPRQNLMPGPMWNGRPPQLPGPGIMQPFPMRQPRFMQQAMMQRSIGGQIRGPGTGTSDDIPARLSDGEYVIPAHVVAALGDGSTDAGAKRLDHLQEQVRTMTGLQMAKGKHPKPAPPPLALLASQGVKS